MTIRPPPRAAQQRQQRLGAVERAGEIDVEHAAPLLGRHFPDRRRAGEIDAGVVDQDVDARQSLSERRRCCRDGEGVGDIDTFDAICAIDRILCRSGIEVPDDDLGPLGDESARPSRARYRAHRR